MEGRRLRLIVEMTLIMALAVIFVPRVHRMLKGGFLIGVGVASVGALMLGEQGMCLKYVDDGGTVLHRSSIWGQG